MRAILIDPFNQNVTEITVAKNSNPAIYAALSPDAAFKVDTFTVLQLDDDVWAFGDDEGFLKEGNACFQLRGYPTPLAGAWLLLGGNDEGDSVDLPARVQAAYIRDRSITWLTGKATGDFGPSREEVIDHPVMGKVPAFIGGAPILREPDAEA